MPKTGDKLTAHAATIDVQPSISQGNIGFFNKLGGQPSGSVWVNDPTSVPFSTMTASAPNISASVGGNAGNQNVSIYNANSTLDMDMAFVEFSMNVTVPAGGKITVQYKFDVTAKKAADSSDGSSNFASELFHFGTGDKTTGLSPVDVSTLSFEPLGGGGTYSVSRVDGGIPASVFGCTISGDRGYTSSHSGSMYPNIGNPVAGCASPSTDTYTTADIVYENDTANSITFKEYFGYMGCALSASGSCHLFYSQVDVTTVKAEFEKTAKPAASGTTWQNWDGTPKTFTLSGLSTKVALVKAEKTALDGTVTSLYEYTNWPVSPKTETGTNPITGTNQCAFTDAGKYTLSFRPIGAVWSGSLDSTAVDVTFYVLPKKVNKPTVAAGDASGKTYSGAAQTYSLALSGGLTAANWSTYINVDAAQGGNLPTGVTDNNNGSFSVTDVGDYDVYLTLVDPENMCWNDSTFTTTNWIGPAGGTNLVTLKMKPYEVTVSSLTCDKTVSGSWAWNMGDTATVTLTLSDFFLQSDADDTDPNKVSLIYYYCVGANPTENPVSAKTQTYDKTNKTISATIEMPTSLAQGTYTFGVKPDEHSGAGKNYTVSSTLSKKSFTVSAKGFDPSVLVWTYSIDGASDATRRIADGDKLIYTLNSSGNATVYNPQIMLITDTYDYTSKIGIDPAGYSGDVNVSAVSATYATTVTLTVTDTDTKFVNPNSNANVTVSADGRTATVKLNWEIEKGTFDLTGLEWEYWYKDAGGNEQKGNYTGALEYNDNRWIYVRLKDSSLPKGLTFNSNYTTVMSGYDTYGDRQKNVGQYTTNFQVNDFDYDATSFNAPDGTASTLTLNWEIEPKTIVAKFKLTKRNYTNGNGSGSYYVRELDLTQMGVPASYASYFELKYYDSQSAEVTLAAIDAAADPTVEKTYTVKAFTSSTVPAAANYKIKDASGNTPTATFKTGSSNSPASLTIGGADGTTPIKVTYDGNPQFGGSLIEVKADDGTVLTANDYDVVYYTGATPIAGNELAAGTYPTDSGTYCVEIVLKNGAENTYILVQEYLSVEIEKQEVSVSVGGATDPATPLTAVYDGNNHFDADVIKLTGAGGNPFTDYTLVYYKDSPDAGNELGEGEYPKGYGKYFVKIVPNAASASNFDLSADTFAIEISRQKIAVPQVTGEIVFNGKPQNLSDYLDDKYTKYLDKGIIEASGQFSGIRNAGSYTAYLNLIDANYEWDYDAGKTGAKLSLTDGEITVSGTDVQAGYNWAIAPFKLDGNALWNTSEKEGAALNLPEWVTALVSDGKLVVGYRYYEDTASAAMENPELKAGSSYWVDAVLTGDDASNFVFANGTQTSEKATYTVPQSGASAVFGKAVSFIKSNWLWFLIGLLALIFLIILICIIAHRKKTKEIREEKKAQKEEEKRRKEEQREEEKRRKEQERELEKAKAEAELAKMRAGLGLGAGAAGLAMAAQQQPMQQQMQPMQQQMQPMQQQMQPMMQQMPQYPQYMPQQQYGDPVMMSELARLKAENEMRLKTELERARAETERAKAEAEIARRGGMMPQFTLSDQNGGTPSSIPMDVLGALVVSALKNMGNAAPKLEEPKPVLTESTSPTAVETPTVYPPDAVITTTTTVDTTKSKPEPVSRDSDRNFDIDGFYDTFDKQDV